MGLAMKPHYRGSTRQAMQRAGRALPKKIYRCGYCGEAHDHDQMKVHEEQCLQRPGSTVKAPTR